MAIGEVISAIKESIILAEKVETLSEEVSALNLIVREDTKGLNLELKENREKLSNISERMVRIESLIEFSQSAHSNSTSRLTHG